MAIFIYSFVHCLKGVFSPFAIKLFFSLLLIYLFPRASITKHNKLGGLNNRNLFFHNLKTEVQDQGGAELCSFPLTSSSFWQPKHLLACRYITSISLSISREISPHVSIYIPLLIRTPVLLDLQTILSE